MRDLSKLNVGPKDSGFFTVWTKRLVVLVVGIVVVLGGVKFLISKASSGNLGSSIILQEAPRGLVPVEVDETEVLAGEGVNLATEKVSLVDVRHGGEAKATATRSFGGGTYILSVNATLPDPKNTYYQVWLVGGGEVAPIDYMRGSKTSWSLNLRSADKYSSHDGIWITLERTKDELPEEHVMEGSF